MTPRASWKGFLKINEFVCPVALHAAASTAGRMALHTVNRRTGHRIHRLMVDRETGQPVERDDQVKGYEIAPDDYVMLEADEIAAAIPDGDKVLSVEAFIACDEIEKVYIDRPYYLTPADAAAAGAHALLHQALLKRKVAAIAHAVLFRRVRPLLIRAFDHGLLAMTLSFGFEVRPARDAFAGIPAIDIQDEMLDLARHIIDTKRGHFDPAAFDDRYEAALVELVRAKIDGRAIKPAKLPARTRTVDLMEALRRSVAGGGPGQKPAGGRKSADARKTKTGPARSKTPAEPKRRAAG